MLFWCEFAIMRTKVTELSCTLHYVCDSWVKATILKSVLSSTKSPESGDKLGYCWSRKLLVTPPVL